MHAAYIQPLYMAVPATICNSASCSPIQAGLSRNKHSEIPRNNSLSESFAPVMQHGCAKQQNKQQGTPAVRNTSPLQMIFLTASILVSIQQPAKCCIYLHLSCIPARSTYIPNLFFSCQTISAPSHSTQALAICIQNQVTSSCPSDMGSCCSTADVSAHPISVCFHSIIQPKPGPVFQAL